MATYSVEYEKAREVRSNAVMAIRSVRTLKEDAETRRDDLLPILFGQGTDQGIMSVIALYMEQARLTAGRKTSTPDFSSDYVTQFKSDLALCVKGSGDGDDGLYPPEIIDGQPSEKAQKDFNKNSKWLNSYSLESVAAASSKGIKQFCQDVLTAVGTSALANANHRGPYPSQTDAESHAQIDRGSGYLALRTENSEIYSEASGSSSSSSGEASGSSSSSSEEPAAETWYIGKNGIDTPDNYTFKADLISVIDSLLTSMNSYKINLENTLAALANKGAILEEFKVELPTDESRLNSAMTKIIGDIELITSYRTYFNAISTGTSSNRTAINAKLEDLKTDCNALITYYETASSQSTLELGDINSGIRKGLIYWTEELVKKPDGAYATLEGIPQLLSDAESQLQNADTRLNAFSSDVNSWLSVPEAMGVFNQAVLNIDKSIKRWETHITWKNVLPANKYKILRKVVTSFSGINNDAWDIQDPTVIVELNEAGFLLTEHIITPPTQHTLFRVLACDEDGSSFIKRADSFNSYSEQSDVISNPISFSELPKQEECSCLHITEEKMPFVETDFAIINDSVLAQVQSVSENDLRLDDDYGEINSIKKLFGFYFATEL